jgi:glycosyltransferase involved in cell wall biosynthesis
VVTIVVPTRNEAPNIERLVEELDGVLRTMPMEILFVDDSDDETPRKIATLRRRRRTRPITLLHRGPRERADGLGGAVLRGIRQAKGLWVCVMDADLQHPPAVLEQLVARAVEGDADVVIASRYRGGGGAVEFGPVRSAVSRVSGLAARVLFPRRLRGVTDPMSGFFLVRKDAVPVDDLKPRGFKILLEILARTPDLRVREVPFVFGVRHAGASKASLREGLTYLGQLLRLRVGEDFLRFALVGVTGLGANALAFLAFEQLGMHYLLAALLATQVSTSWNFVLSELWVFARRRPERPLPLRVASFFVLNNLLLVARGPVLIVLVSVLGMGGVAANAVTLLALALSRFGFATSWIWSGPEAAPGEEVTYCYSVHGIVTVESPVRLPELERFRVERLTERPTIRVRLGKLSKTQSQLVSALAFMSRHTRYDEGLGRFGFGIEIVIGRWTEIVASPLLAFSPHVLYTNVVEPTLRWAFVKRGYALAHAACIAFDGKAYLVTARTDTGKTTTILKTLDKYEGAFLSDDLTLISPDGRVLPYPKPLTISRHTVHAIKTPLLSRAERFALIFQSRLHSRSGRQFAMVIARLHFPAATINAIVQLLVPPPKYDISRLVPGVEVPDEARLAGLAVIQRGGTGDYALSEDEAIETLVENTNDAYGFPPYPAIEHFLHSGNCRQLLVEEREILSSALSNVPAILLKSDTLDWHERLPKLVLHGTPSGRREQASVPVLDAVFPLAFE